MRKVSSMYSFIQFIDHIENKNLKESVISSKENYLKNIQDNGILPDKFDLDDILFDYQEETVVVCIKGYDTTKGWFNSDYIQVVFFYPENYKFADIITKTNLSQFKMKKYPKIDNTTFVLTDKPLGEQYLDSL